ncbi:MAG: voltage-gated chloride channel protein, partial [Lachnospiraceae bacterium]|nr:voltage-gated chloride channel protein [Candidatus Equihabitans merdae]
MNSKLPSALKEYRDTIIIALICIPLGAVIGAIDAVFGRVLLAITAFRGEHIYLLIPFLALAGALIVFCYSRYGKGSDKGMGLIFA